MKIAITSQNFRTITGHAGKTRRFLIYQVSDGEVRELERLDLPKELSFHEFHGAHHPIDGVDAMITAGSGAGFLRRMAERGIRVVRTSLQDPHQAAAALAAGQPLPPPDPAEEGHAVPMPH